MEGIKVVKACKKCATSYDGRDCPSCKKISAKKYRLKNKDKILAYDATYRESLRRSPSSMEKNRIKSSEWKKNNRDKINAKIAANKLKNPDKYKLMDAARMARYIRPAGAAVIHASNRRARKRANGGSLSIGIAGKLFKLQRGKCACCGAPLGDNYHIDHIEPLSRGGLNADSNIQLLTALCNMQKHAKDPIDFMQSRGFLL